jgi:alpha-ribazole phosphatase CobZ
MAKRQIPLNLKDAKAEIVYHSFREELVKTLLITFSEKRRVLSTLEGFKEVRFVGNHYNPPSLWDYVHKNYQEYLNWLPQALSISREDIAYLSTGADMDNLAMAEKIYEDFRVICLATAGVEGNAQRLGEDVAQNIEREGKFEKVEGTINLIILTNTYLADGAMARTIITSTEAKTAVLQDLDIRSTYTPLENQATGTGTDNMIVISGKGEKISYVGGHTKMGELIARAVKDAVIKAIEKQNSIISGRGLEKRLAERGISLKELVDTALLLYIPDPKIGSKYQVKTFLQAEFKKAFKDLNVCSLVMAGLHLEECARRGAIPELPQEKYERDPVDLIADELLGIQIAQYIGGSRAMFEFERYDKKKPGILGKLPPFLDDIVGGLIAGVLVKVCS